MERIIIDTDPGIDDTFAIMLALRSDRLKVEGITTVEGNGTIDQVTRNALRILSVAGRTDIKVYRGCSLPGHDTSEVKEIHGDDAWGDVWADMEPEQTEETEHAVDYIIRMVGDNPHEITLATLGPLQNIAEAIRKAPEVMMQVKRIVIMGGAVKGGNITHNAEANIYNAPEAAATVFSSGIDAIVMVGLDATTKFLFDANRREILNQLRDPVARMLYTISEVYVNFYWKVDSIPGFIPHDVLVLMYLIDESLIGTVDADITVIHTPGDHHGHTAADITSTTPNAKACMTLKYDEAISLYFRTLFPDDQEKIEEALQQLKQRLP